MNSDPLPRRDPLLQLGLAVDPLDPHRAELPALRRDLGHLRLLHPQIRRSRQGLGPPLLPALQLGDERRLVPLGARASTATRPGEYVTAWRHVHDIFTSVGATNVDLGLVPQRRPEPTTSRTSAASTRATPTSTGPASTATTGARTRPSPIAGAASTSSTTRPTTKITDYDRPLEAADDQRDRLDRVRRLEGGLDPGHAGEDSHQLPEDPRPALVRAVRRRHGLADRDLEPARPAPSPPASRTRPTRATSSAPCAFGAISAAG